MMHPASVAAMCVLKKFALLEGRLWNKWCPEAYIIFISISCIIFIANRSLSPAQFEVTRSLHDLHTVVVLVVVRAGRGGGGGGEGERGMPCMCSRVVYMRVCIFVIVVVVLCLVLSLASTRSLCVNYSNCIAYQFKLLTTFFLNSFSPC